MSLLHTLHPVDHNKALLRKLYEGCFNTGELTLIHEMMAEDFIAEPGVLNREGFAAQVRNLRTAFPDVHFQIEDLIGEQDRVVARWRFEATHKAPFAGVPASGRRVTQTGTVIYQVREGRLARAWIQVDRLGLLQQISEPPVPKSA